VGWQLAAILLVMKFVATFACYWFGGCGGIFSPTLFFGEMTGALFAGLVSLQGQISRADTLTLAVVGMSACLSGVVFAPVTGILIVFEMNRFFSGPNPSALSICSSQMYIRHRKGHSQTE
jgi:CIC family chloride channel protein